MQTALGAPVHNVALGVTGAFAALGIGAMPGDGTCERYWVENEVEVQEGGPHAVARVRGGTGDVQLRLPKGTTVWCSGHHYRPWQLSDGPLSDDEAPSPPIVSPPPQPAAAALPTLPSAPPSTPPSTLPSTPPPAPSDMSAVIDAARLERQAKHPRMRRHLRWLIASQCGNKAVEFADKLGISRGRLSQ